MIITSHLPRLIRCPWKLSALQYHECMVNQLLWDKNGFNFISHYVCICSIKEKKKKKQEPTRRWDKDKISGGANYEQEGMGSWWALHASPSGTQQRHSMDLMRYTWVLGRGSWCPTQRDEQQIGASACQGWHLSCRCTEDIGHGISRGAQTSTCCRQEPGMFFFFFGFVFEQINIK
jgi:hypothetical protein